MSTTTNSEGETILAKGGETVTRINIQRGKDGLKISVWAHPSIEAVMRDLAGEYGRTGVLNYGSHWTSKEQAFNVWDFPKEVFASFHRNEPPFTLNYPGGTMLLQDSAGRHNHMLNLSFLRLEGISTGAGVTFTVKGVFQEDYINKLRDQIEQASITFYKAVLKPIELTITVTSQEM